MDVRDLIIHYKDQIIKIMDVEMEKYNYIELSRDAWVKANESQIEFSKYVGLDIIPNITKTKDGI